MLKLVDEKLGIGFPGDVVGDDFCAVAAGFVVPFVPKFTAELKAGFDATPAIGALAFADVVSVFCVPGVFGRKELMPGFEVALANVVLAVASDPALTGVPFVLIANPPKPGFAEVPVSEAGFASGLVKLLVGNFEVVVAPNAGLEVDEPNPEDVFAVVEGMLNFIPVPRLAKPEGFAAAVPAVLESRLGLAAVLESVDGLARPVLGAGSKEDVGLVEAETALSDLPLNKLRAVLDFDVVTAADGCLAGDGDGAGNDTEGD